MGFAGLSWTCADRGENQSLRVSFCFTLAFTNFGAVRPMQQNMVKKILTMPVSFF